MSDEETAYGWRSQHFSGCSLFIITVGIPQGLKCFHLTTFCLSVIDCWKEPR